MMLLSKKNMERKIHLGNTEQRNHQVKRIKRGGEGGSVTMEMTTPL